MTSLGSHLITSASCVLCLAIGAIAALVTACFFCSIGASADGLLDVVSTLVISVAFGFYLTRRKNLQDSDDHEKRLFTRTSIPLIKEKIDSLSEILDSATGETLTFPNLDRRSKTLFKEIRTDLDLLHHCLERIEGQGDTTWKFKISSLNLLVDTVERNWSEFSGETITPDNMGKVKEDVNRFVKDIYTLYLDTIDRVK